MVRLKSLGCDFVINSYLIGIPSDIKGVKSIFKEVNGFGECSQEAVRRFSLYIGLYGSTENIVMRVVYVVVRYTRIVQVLKTS